MQKLIFTALLSLFVATHANNDGGAAFAATINDSEAIFGQWCYKSIQGCYWILASDTACDTGEDYPSLINSTSAAISATMRCTSIAGVNRLVFKDFSLIDDAIKNDGVLAIATPMKNGSFKVQRFDLKGVQPSLNAMRRIYETMVNGKTGTKDIAL